jgi:hypothetical protein
MPQPNGTAWWPKTASVKLGPPFAAGSARVCSIPKTLSSDRHVAARPALTLTLAVQTAGIDSQAFTGGAMNDPFADMKQDQRTSEIPDAILVLAADVMLASPESQGINALTPD